MFSPTSSHLLKIPGSHLLLLDNFPCSSAMWISYGERLHISMAVYLHFKVKLIVGCIHGKCLFLPSWAFFFQSIAAVYLGRLRMPLKTSHPRPFVNCEHMCTSSLHWPLNVMMLYWPLRQDAWLVNQAWWDSGHAGMVKWCSYLVQLQHCPSLCHTQHVVGAQMGHAGWRNV